MSYIDTWIYGKMHYLHDKQKRKEYLYLTVDQENPDKVEQPTKGYPLGWIFCTTYRFLLNLFNRPDRSSKNKLKPIKFTFTRNDYEIRTLRRFAHKEISQKGEAISGHEVVIKEDCVRLSKFLIKWVQDMQPKDERTLPEFLLFIDDFLESSVTNASRYMRIEDLVFNFISLR